MKKFSILFSVLAILLSIQSFAIPKDPCDKKVTCCDEAKSGPFAFSYPKDIGLACPRDFYTFGEFLYMKAIEDGLDYGITDSNPLGILPVIGDVVGFSSRSEEWGWRPGFRAGIGTYIIHDEWNVEATWTYVRIKADSSASVPGNNIIIPIYIPQSTNVFNAMSARWSGDYNTFDISFGKPYHVSRYFVSHPMIGIRAAWIDQDFHVRHFDIGHRKFSALFKNDFWGVGIRGIYKGEFNLGSNWLIFGKAAVAFLLGKFDTDAHNEPLFQAGSYSIQDSFYNTTPNIEFGLGISWKKFFNKNHYLLSVKAAYEFHHWWEQNRMKFAYNSFLLNAIVAENPKEDLSLGGFAFGIHLDF